MGDQRRARLDELAAACPVAHLIGDGATPITGIVYDSRLVTPGALFAALRGADFDGHDYAPEAVGRGASALLVERPLAVAAPMVIVPDSRAALARVAAAFYAPLTPHPRVIGVTGTDGKTTTTYLIDAILRAAGYRTGMVGTVAVRIADEVVEHDTRQTTPESVEVQRYLRTMGDRGADWAILEATSHGLAMHRLDQVRFEIGAVTNITHEHLEFHRTIADYRRAKAILFERVAASGGTAIINADDEGARAMAPFAEEARVLTYSCAGAAADLRALDIVATTHSSRFRLHASAWGSHEIELPLIGRFNVANALCAAGVALAAGVDLVTIASALSAAPAIPGRMTTIDAGQPFSVIVDYAHTPESLTKVLTLLRGLHPTGRLIAVFGSAGERDIEKRSLQGAVAARLADYAVFTSEDPRHEDPDAIIAAIAGGAAGAGGRVGVTFACMTDRREAIHHALDVAQPGDCILLAGKGHEGSIIWGREKVAWDETTVARELLAGFGFTAKSGA